MNYSYSFNNLYSILQYSRKNDKKSDNPKKRLGYFSSKILKIVIYLII